jgi:Ca2+:H+ antiporter
MKIEYLDSRQQLIVGGAVALTAAAGLAAASGAGPVTRFVLAGLALAGTAAVVGEAIEAVGERVGPSLTGLLQSTLGNLPELFVGIFALHRGLTAVVQAALVGSVLGNSLLVLGLAFLVGGLRHGTQRFEPELPRLISSLLLLVVAAMLVPTLAQHLGSPAARHSTALSDGLAAILLVVYLASVPYFLRHSPQLAPAPPPTQPPMEQGPTSSGGANTAEPRTATPGVWPLSLSVAILTAGSAAAAGAAEWFVGPLQSATTSLGLSQTFTGLVVVAIASNAVENAVGVRFALRAKSEYVIATILNSPLQVALLLTPVLVLLSGTVGPSHLTLVFPPLLVVALAVAALVVTVIIYDGEYTWIEGVALIALYAIVAAAFWWG